jgi:3-oxoacyl-[acyl-carrier protein] reductase
MTVPAGAELRRYGLGGHVALVTGGGQGVGRAVALGLAREGCRVVITGRQRTTLDAVEREIRALGAEALPVVADIRRADDVTAMVSAAAEAYGRIDFLVNNAGVTSSALVHEMTEEQWDLVLGTNLKGPFLCSRAVVPHMMRERFGRIVNVCSIASFLGQEGRANYAASKAGLMALTKVMAQELARHGIRVNAVAPALLDTDMIRRNLPQDFLADIVVDRKPMGRLGDPAEAAEVVLFLLSEGSSYVTGETILVDGGLLSGYFYTDRGFGRSLPGSRPAPAS